jgi:hypothetical protein
MYLGSSFNFPKYLMLSKEEHIIKMLKISPWQWLTFVVVILLNLLRCKAQGSRIRELGELCETNDDKKREVSLIICLFDFVL